MKCLYFNIPISVCCESCTLVLFLAKFKKSIDKCLLMRYNRGTIKKEGNST